MGGLVTTPSRIFYNDSFVEEEDITNTEEILGSTFVDCPIEMNFPDAAPQSIHFHTLSR